MKRDPKPLGTTGRSAEGEALAAAEVLGGVIAAGIGVGEGGNDRIRGREI